MTAVDLDTDVSLYDPLTRQVAMLNRTARAVWDAFAEPRSVEDVAGALAPGFGTDADAILADVRAATEDLLRAGMLLPVADTPE